MASKPQVFDHLFFDDGGKPFAVPLFYFTITQKHLEDATTGDKCCVMDYHLARNADLRGALRHVSAHSMAQRHTTLKLNWVYAQAMKRQQLHSYYWTAILLQHGL